MVFGDINRERMAEWDLLKLQQTRSTADYMVYFTQLSTATDWDNIALTAMYYTGLKDRVKDKIARGEWPDDLYAIMIMAIRINNCLYEQRKEKGQTF